MINRNTLGFYHFHVYCITRHGFQKVFSFLLLVKVAANIISGTIYTLYFPSLCNTKQFAIYEILEPILHYLKCITESIFWSFESSAVWRWKGRYAKKCNVSHTSLCSRTCKQRWRGEIFSVEKFKIEWYACGHIWTGRNCHVEKSQGLKSNTLLWRNSRLVTRRIFLCGGITNRPNFKLSFTPISFQCVLPKTFKRLTQHIHIFGDNAQEANVYSDSGANLYRSYKLIRLFQV